MAIAHSRLASILPLIESLSLTAVAAEGPLYAQG